MNLMQIDPSTSSGCPILGCFDAILNHADQLQPIEQKKKTKRPHGLCKGQFVVSEDFNNPLSDEILDLFYRKEEPIR